MLSTFLSFILDLFPLLYRFLTRPRLRMGDWRVLLNHEVQVGRDEFSTEIIYGFDIQNCGRKAARSVRAYLVKKEARHKDDVEFGLVSAHTTSLPWYGAQSDDRAAVLVPGALKAVELDRWWEGEPWGDDHGWGAAAQFRFTVAVVEDGDEQARKEFVVDNPRPEEPLPIEFWADFDQPPPEDASLGAKPH